MALKCSCKVVFAAASFHAPLRLDLNWNLVALFLAFSAHIPASKSAVSRAHAQNVKNKVILPNKAKQFHLNFLQNM